MFIARAASTTAKIRKQPHTHTCHIFVHVSADGHLCCFCILTIIDAAAVNIVWITTNCGIFFKWIGRPDHLTCLVRNLYAGQEATVRTRHGTTDWLKIGKEYIKAVHYHPAYLTSMQSISCKMPGWMKHKMESRLPGEISTTSDIQMIPPMAESEEELKSLLMWVIEGEAKLA